MVLHCELIDPHKELCLDQFPVWCIKHVFLYHGWCDVLLNRWLDIQAQWIMLVRVNLVQFTEKFHRRLRTGCQYVGFGQGIPVDIQVVFMQIRIGYNQCGFVVRREQNYVCICDHVVWKYRSQTLKVMPRSIIKVNRKTTRKRKKRWEQMHQNPEIMYVVVIPVYRKRFLVFNKMRDGQWLKAWMI